MIYLEEARPIQADSYSLPDNLSWVDQVIQDSVVHGHQSAGPGSLLLQLVGLPGGLGQDPPLGDEDHVLTTELLLQLSDQPTVQLCQSLTANLSFVLSHLVWIFWNAFSCGTGTKITRLFLPSLQSTSLAAVMWSSLRAALRSLFTSRSRRA